MRLTVRLDGPHAELWHLDLLQRLAKRPDTSVTADISPGAGRLSRQAGWLLRFDAALDGSAGSSKADLSPYLQKLSSPPDLAIDLCGDPALGPGRVWRLTFGRGLDGEDGRPGLSGLLDMLLTGQPPVAVLREGEQVIAAGRLGTEYGGTVQAALKDYQARAVTLILSALDGTARTPPVPGSGAGRQAATPARTAARRAVSKVLRQGYRLWFDSPHWQVGWRRLDGPDLFDLRRHPDTGWHTLPDDGRRFYADPFPVEHDGRTTLFLEEFPHRAGKGVISAVVMGQNGPEGRPEMVLEQPGHLSYPFVFPADGEMWMIPESCAAGQIDLFRATAFPGGWVREATLVQDVIASDATLTQHGGRWWMFATVRDGGAYSDTLHLWYADDFRGPWVAHAGNPVLIDIASARPAGRMVVRDGVLLRPVQDCSQGYGAALGIARVDRLDEDGFAQQVETVLTAGPLWPGRRLHTLNSGGGFEFIDGSALARRRWIS